MNPSEPSVRPVAEDRTGPRRPLLDARAHLRRADPAELRGAGLSGRKVATLRDLAERVSQRQLPGLDLRFLPAITAG